MNDESICSRWRKEAHQCELSRYGGDSLLDPVYFNPPISPNGEVTLSVVTFHHSYPTGREFKRAALGEHWTRIT